MPARPRATQRLEKMCPSACSAGCGQRQFTETSQTCCDPAAPRGAASVRRNSMFFGRRELLVLAAGLSVGCNRSAPTVTARVAGLAGAQPGRAHRAQWRGRDFQPALFEVDIGIQQAVSEHQDQLPADWLGGRELGRSSPDHRFWRDAAPMKDDESKQAPARMYHIPANHRRGGHQYSCPRSRAAQACPRCGGGDLQARSKNGTTPDRGTTRRPAARQGYFGGVPHRRQGTNQRIHRLPFGGQLRVERQVGAGQERQMAGRYRRQGQ